jgi:hypothetical protein
VFPVGTATVTCTAEADGGIEERTSFDVTVEDRTKPTLNIRGPIVQEARAKDGAVVNFDITASDAVDGVFDATCDPASGTRFMVGTHEVTCTATDHAGNAVRGSFKVTVDDLPPILSVPSDISLAYTSRAGRTVSFPRPLAHDQVDGAVSVRCSKGSGSRFPLGTTTVRCFATDSAGQRSDRSFTVEIYDNVPPELTVPPSRAETAPARERSHLITFVTSASDAIDGTVPVTCDPSSGTAFSVGTTTWVSCKAADQAGNSVVKRFSVTVARGSR